MLKEEIDNFLSEKRVAFVGASRNKSKFSNTVYKKLKSTGYEVHPMHPEMESVDGDACVRNVRELPDDVQALMIIASQGVSATALKDVHSTNIGHIWVFCGKKPGPDVEAEIERLKSSGISVISGICPFMFLEPVDSVHSVHRFFVRLVGKYPK